MHIQSLILLRLRGSVLPLAALILLSLIALPSQAQTHRFYTFEEPDWSDGGTLSDFKFDTEDNTTGVIDVVTFPGAPSTGPVSAPVFPPGGGGTQALFLQNGGELGSISGMTNNNGMGNNIRINGRLWGSVDIFKGSGEAGFIWSLVFMRNAGNAPIMGIDGGWDTVRLRQINEVSASIPLADGWNQVVLMNDAFANPNITMWLNGKVVAQIHGGGDADNSGARLQKARLTKQGRDDATFEGSMYFDNIFGGNHSPAFFKPAKEYYAVPTMPVWTLVLTGLLLILLIRRRLVI